MSDQPLPKREFLADDFALDRVPPSGRKPMREILWIELGIVTAMTEFIIASALGYGMTFWQALLSITLGTSLLLLVTVLIGIAGAWEGLPSGLLSRWCGFGRIGSGLISLVIAIGCTAWFGVQNSICAEAITRSTHGWIGFPLASAITGSVLIVITALGVDWISKTASVVVPVFLALVAYGTYKILAGTSLTEIIATPAPGPHLGVFTGASMIAGGLMIGGIVAPDFTRFCRKGADVFWAMLIAFLIGEFGLGMASVLLSHAARTSDIISIIFAVAGWLGVAVVVLDRKTQRRQPLHFVAPPCQHHSGGIPSPRESGDSYCRSGNRRDSVFDSRHPESHHWFFAHSWRDRASHRRNHHRRLLPASTRPRHAARHASFAEPSIRM